MEQHKVCQTPMGMDQYKIAADNSNWSLQNSKLFLNICNILDVVWLSAYFPSNFDLKEMLGSFLTNYEHFGLPQADTHIEDSITNMQMIKAKLFSIYILISSHNLSTFTSESALVSNV